MAPITSVEYETVCAKLVDKPKTWLVTGAAGFIGSNLVEALLMLGQRVIGVDNFSTGKRDNLDEVRSTVGGSWANFRLIEGDVADFDVCQAACDGVQYILHQAALGSVPRSIDEPLETNRANVDGHICMMEAARQSGVERFVYASTSAIYGDSEELPKFEERIGAALSPYAVSKHVNELYADVYARVYGFESIGLRYFNVFGKRQDPEGPYAAVIPVWIRAMIANEPAYINGNGETARDFCYIENVIQANLLAATTTNAEAVNTVYNIACGESTTLNELFEMLRSALRQRFEHLESYQPVYRDFRPGDVFKSLADISKAGKLLKYVPTYKMSDGISGSLNWYIAHLSKERTA